MVSTCLGCVGVMSLIWISGVDGFTPIGWTHHIMDSRNYPSQHAKRAKTSPALYMSRSEQRSRDFYDILGVSRDAGPKTLKQAYRRLAKLYHPDNDSSVEATEMFQAVSRAYEVLQNPELRKLYNSFGEQGIGTSAASDERKGQESAKQERNNSIPRSPFQRAGFNSRDFVKDAGSFFQRRAPGPVSGGKAQDCMACGGKGVTVQVMKTPHGNIRIQQPCRSCRLVWDASEVMREFVPFTKEELDYARVEEGAEDRSTFVDTPTSAHVDASSGEAKPEEMPENSSLFTSKKMEIARDLYDILGVPRDADSKAIKQAYRTLAKLYHPDSNPSPSATETFQEVNLAYEVLGNEELKRKYDAFGEQEIPRSAARNRKRGITDESDQHETQEASKYIDMQRGGHPAVNPDIGDNTLWRDQERTLDETDVVDYYAVLGITKNAENDAIKQAYRMLAKLYHPDTNPNLDATEKFQEVNRAYEILGDPKLKKQYDAFGEQGIHRAAVRDRKVTRQTDSSDPNIYVSTNDRDHAAISDEEPVSPLENEACSAGVDELANDRTIQQGQYAASPEDDILDCYEALGVSKNSDAQIITQAYNMLVRLYRPDANPNSSSSKRFREINRAYEVLNNEELKKQYDTFGKMGFADSAAFGTECTQHIEFDNDEVVNTIPVTSDRKSIDSADNLNEKPCMESESSVSNDDQMNSSVLPKENLQNLTKQDTGDTQSEKREQDPKESLETSSQHISKLESEVVSESKSKADLQDVINQLQKKLDSSEEEKTRLAAEIEEIKRNLEKTSSEMQGFCQEQAHGHPTEEIQPSSKTKDHLSQRAGGKSFESKRMWTNSVKRETLNRFPSVGRLGSISSELNHKTQARNAFSKKTTEVTPEAKKKDFESSIDHPPLRPDDSVKTSVSTSHTSEKRQTEPGKDSVSRKASIHRSQILIEDVQVEDSFFKSSSVSGGGNGKTNKCRLCGGTGVTVQVVRTNQGDFQMQQPCRSCCLVTIASDVMRSSIGSAQRMNTENFSRRPDSFSDSTTAPPGRPPSGPLGP